MFLAYAKIFDSGYKNFALGFVFFLALESAAIMPLMQFLGMDITRLFIMELIRDYMHYCSAHF